MSSTILAVGAVMLMQFHGDVAMEGLLGAASSQTSSDTSAPPPIGRCGTYVAIDGSAKILRVDETAASVVQAAGGGGPRYAGYEVWFSFTPNEAVTDAQTAAWIAGDHQLRLMNSWYPGPQFVKKYGLEAGKTIPAVLEVQKAGPCAPFVFRFPSVDTADYFENGK
jgi:hypothetical protein